MKKRILTLTVILAALAAVVVAATPQTEREIGPRNGTIRFVVIGDRTGGHVPGVYEQAIAEIVRLRPDFSVTVGDQIEGYSSDSAEVAGQWREYDSIVKPLPSPLYLTPGNHDITSDQMEPWYRLYAGKPYYSFDQLGSHFIVLDVSRWEFGDPLPKAEMDWLVDDLKHNQLAAHTFVFFHKPYWIQSLQQNKPDTLHQLFVRYGVDAVFNGHFHEYFSGKRDGIIYTSVGSSGAEATPMPNGLQYHFTWVTVDSTGIQITPIKLGSVLPWDELTVTDKMAIDRIYNLGLTYVSPVPVEEDLTVRDTVVELRLNNSFAGRETDDTLRWTVPPNWTVEPQTAAVKLAAGETKNLSFRVRCAGMLYPVPTAQYTFNYGKDGKITAKSDLKVARQAFCHNTGTPVTLDGAVTENCWFDPITRFFAPDGGPLKTDPVKFYFAHDKDYLYLAALCTDQKTDSLRAKITQHDGLISSEDCVGFFLEPIKKDGVVYQIYINPLGTIFDQKLTKGSDGWVTADKNWNVICDVKTSKGNGFWSMEARLPVKQFGAVLKSGDQWRLNFRRKQPRLQSSADWQAPIDYDAETYGVMIIK
jgi:predicted phosphodiesterase